MRRWLERRGSQTSAEDLGCLFTSMRRELLEATPESEIWIQATMPGGIGWSARNAGWAV
jgi:hypothetical protein